MAYLCSQGFWTIGYGRNLETNGLTDDEQRMIFGDVLSKPTYIEKLKSFAITDEQAEALLLRDLSNAEESCHKYINMGLHNGPRQAVLINMCFQLGISGLLGFKKALSCLSEQQYDSASREMLDSKWSLQTPKRAKTMANQMATGEWL